MSDSPTIAAQATPAACARWDSIVSNLPEHMSVELHDIMSDGGFTFGLWTGREGRTFAVNPDGGKAYPLTY